MNTKQLVEKFDALQPQQEPVAWLYWQSCLNDDGTQTAPWVQQYSKFKPQDSRINRDVTPLYATPHPHLKAMQQALECEWHKGDDEYGIWESACGESWSFVDGGPTENRMLYCHRCGGKLREVLEK